MNLGRLKPRRLFYRQRIEAATKDNKPMTAKFDGTCRACGGAIHKGDWITYTKRTGAIHSTCPDSGANHRDEDEAAGLEPGTLANDRRLASRGLSVARFASGAVVTQNSRGRCEDAPCCGCCS